MPPRRFNYEGEISLRHLPDTSDTSFSFQIPNALSGNDRLLDEDDMTFLRDTNDDDMSPATPGSDRSNFGPLTLEELAQPYPEANHDRHSAKPFSACYGSKAPLKPTLPAPEQEQARVTRSKLPKDKMRPNLKLTSQNAQTSAEIKSSAISKFDVLRAEFEALDNETPDSPDLPPSTNIPESSHQNRPKASSSKQEWPAMKTERLRTKAVISGGIIKTRSRKAASSGIVHNLMSVPVTQEEVLLPLKPQSRVLSDNADFSLHSESLDLNICSTAPDGVGENLVMYSETSTRPVTQHASASNLAVQGDPESCTQRRSSIAENDYQTGDGRNDPLTLSQISPSKEADSHLIPPAVVPSGLSMRQSTKRPASEPSSPQPATKKGRSHAIASDDASGIITRAHGSAGSRAPAKSSSSGSGSGRARVRRIIQQTRDLHEESTSLRQKPTVRKSILEKSSGEDVTATLSRSDTTCSSSDLSNPRFSRLDNLATSGTSVQGSEEAGSSRSMGMPPCHERAALPLANRTKPVGFKFQIDARIEARKAEFENEKLLPASQKRRMRKHHQVPDFKTIHAAEEARLGLRKRSMVPTVPLPFELSTDGRAREREKFEEHLRQKERESQRVLEEKRREEQEMEERAIKELRKKAVPRAHEVPEWYKDVPKRKIRDLDTNRD
ncbi:hypothetical protein C0993_000607 [Termitomyces sp. T159_Od127]|nr:hypothetical protein C0993_000607 [Termitomyces sp. T159_Od127]